MNGVMPHEQSMSRLTRLHLKIKIAQQKSTKARQIGLKYIKYKREI